MQKFLRNWLPEKTAQTLTAREIRLNIVGFYKNTFTKELTPIHGIRTLVIPSNFHEGVVSPICNCIQELFPYFYLYEVQDVLGSHILVMKDSTYTTKDNIFQVLYSTEHESLELDLTREGRDIWKIQSQNSYYSSEDCIPNLFGLKKKQLKFE